MHPWVIILFVHYVGQRPAGGWEEEGDLPGDPGAARSTDWAHQREKEACVGGSEQGGASCQGCSARWIKCLCYVQCWDIYSEYSIAWLWLYCCSYDFHCLDHCKYTVNVYEPNLFLFALLWWQLFTVLLSDSLRWHFVIWPCLSSAYNQSHIWESGANIYVDPQEITV